MKSAHTARGHAGGKAWSLRVFLSAALIAVLQGQVAFGQPAVAPAQERPSVEKQADDGIRFQGGGRFHRHFGDVVVGRSDRVIGVHRRASEHGVKGHGEIVYYTSDDHGRTVSRETVLASAAPGRDVRDVAMGTTPNGRVLVIWTDTSVDQAGPTHFKSAFSDDNGVSWSKATTFATIPYAYARAYGTIKSFEGGNGRSVLTVPAYFQINERPDYKVALYRSEDEGKTWVEGPPIDIHRNGSSESLYTETDVAWIDPSTGFAVSRSNSGLGVFRSSGGGTDWDLLGRIAKGERPVAPAAYVFESQGSKVLLVFYCDRTSNTTRVRWAPVAALLKNDLSGFARNMKVLSPPDMGNASGYQKVAFYPDGTALMVEFREKGKGDKSSDVRLTRVSPSQWIKQEPPAGGRDGSKKPPAR
jgi:hypothetical protein